MLNPDPILYFHYHQSQPSSHDWLSINGGAHKSQSATERLDLPIQITS